jgi:hypothetical protein
VGFDTAIIHGGVAALGVMISSYLSESRQWRGARLFAPGVLAAMVLHSLFNQGLLSPAASTAVTVAGLPVILGLAFYFSERSLRQWLAGKLDRDIDVLNMIARGVSSEPVRQLFAVAARCVSPKIRGDMLCLLQLTTELSVRAKSDLLFREVGLELSPDPELDNQFKELKYLEKSIGPTGMLAIRLLSQTPRDLWEMHQLAQG